MFRKKKRCEAKATSDEKCRHNENRPSENTEERASGGG